MSYNRIIKHDIIFSAIRKSFSYVTTVLVDTMHSTSLVQRFMKPNHQLLTVMNEPSFILNLLQLVLIFSLVCSTYSKQQQRGQGQVMDELSTGEMNYGAIFTHCFILLQKL